MDEKDIEKDLDPNIDRSIAQYMKEVGRYPLLTAEEERDLFKRIKEEDNREARDKIVTSNLRLVIAIIKKKFSKSSMPFIEKVQNGNLGLFRAVYKFDHTKGYRFSTYATHWIKASIFRAIQDTGRIVRIPVNMHTFKMKCDKVTKELVKELGREPTIEEVAKKMGKTEEAVKKKIEPFDCTFTSYEDFLRHNNSPIEDILSQESLILNSANNEGVYALESCRPKEEDVVDDSLRKKEAFAGLIEKLSARERFIIEKRFFIESPWTLQKIGDHLKISRERVRQIEKNIIKRWRELEEVGELR